MRRLFLALLTLASACGQADRPALAPASAPRESSEPMTSHVPTIVMLGDSLTAGYELAEDEALPAVVERDLAAQGVKAHFVNAGVSGDMTADGLARYDWSVAGAKPDLLVVALGANDFLSGVVPERAKKNLAAILDKAKAANLPAALIGVAIPDTDRSPRDAAYAAIYQDLAKQFDAPMLPDMMAPLSGQPQLLMPDGLHPTAKGIEAMADQVAAFLAPLIRHLPGE